MTTSTPSSTSPLRPALTPAQLVQAEYIGRVTDTHRAQRPTIVTHAIDNVTPEVIADRDDGIFVQVEPTAKKGYLVQITVADVAAHVRLGSPLSEAAWQRAFTVYKPGSTDSMFPKILEENLSLEHKQERLGLTVNITLDEHFRPVNTSFTPVITTPDNASYEQAKQRMRSDPQFALMASIAENVKRSYSERDAAAWAEMVEGQRVRRGLSESDIKTMQMVATYMLLANHCVADFFSASGLPFLYRNFDSSQNDAHASYSTTPLRHSALESMGMSGAYCHFTSPIRRAPDYFNGVMVHYAVNVITELEQNLIKACPDIDRKKLNERLWQHGPEIIKLASSTSSRVKHRAELRILLGKIATEASNGVAVPESAIASLVGGWELPPVPVTHEQLDTYADHMNALVHSPQMQQINRLNEKMDKSVALVEQLATISEEGLAAIAPERFSSILQAAALTGEMPQKLFNETMKRMENGTFDRVEDMFTVFLQAQYPSSERWRGLKREIARMIKNDPGTVNALLYRLDHVAPDSVQELHSHVSDMQHGDRNMPSRMHGSLLVMTLEDGSKVAAPFHSVGHDKRAALSHAKYSFLEHYAFTELQPVEQTALPNLLYADLDLPDAKKRQLFERMVQDSGAQMSIHCEPISSGFHAVLTVSGGDVTVPLSTEADEPTRELATQSAMRRMLRNDVFKIAMSRHEGNPQHLLNPQTVLKEEVERRGGKVEFSINPVDGRTSSGFRAQATVRLNAHDDDLPEEQVFTATEPNKDRALRVAAALALESLGSITPAMLERAASWSSHARRGDGGAAGASPG